MIIKATADYKVVNIIRNLIFTKQLCRKRYVRNKFLISKIRNDKFSFILQLNIIEIYKILIKISSGKLKQLKQPQNQLGQSQLLKDEMNKLSVTLININDTASIQTYAQLLSNIYIDEKYIEGTNIVYLTLQIIKNNSFPYILKYDNDKIKIKLTKLIINNPTSQSSYLVKREFVIKNTSIDSQK
ncbi:hypothetical protein pb186bvf_012731 [Paramecium bursaria]